MEKENNKSKYIIEKEKARGKAIQWQFEFDLMGYDTLELIQWSIYFEKLGKRYGLLKEFRENGIL